MLSGQGTTATRHSARIEAIKAAPATAQPLTSAIAEDHIRTKALSSNQSIARSDANSKHDSVLGSTSRSKSWSSKDDEILVQARAQGLNWNQISPKYFPLKSANACRKRHERLMERQNAEQYDGMKLDIIAQAYMEARREMWGVLAAKVGEKWALVERKVI
jgi:hypothetical protein